MSFLPTIVYLPCLASIVIIAAVTLVNRSTRGAGYFGAFALLIASWLLPQYIAQATNGKWYALTLLRITTLLSLIMAYLFLRFIYSYLDMKVSNRRALYPFMLSALIGILCFSNLGVQKVEASSGGIAIKSAGSLYYVLTLIVLGYFGYGFFLLLRATAHLQKADRTRNYLLFIGLCQAGFLSAVASTVLANSEVAQLIIPVSLSLMVFLVAFTIIKHRLFDIRLIVARTLAYLTSLLVIASAYGLLVFGISALAFRERFPLGVEIFIATATAAASLSFTSVKSFFDQGTRKLFYRDAYDTQVFFDDFNKTLVATYELNQLLKQSAAIVEQNIKPAYCLFVINKTPTTSTRVIGTDQKPAISADEMEKVVAQLDKMKSKLVLFNELEGRHEVLQGLLRAKDIVMTARLSPSSTTSHADVGYLMLGPKKSGNPYSSQDMKVIEIVANELVIAVQNALRFEEIENFNLTLQAKVDDATKKLRKANERLKAIDETKDDFISMASHQLRTPLTSIKGYLSMVLEGDAGKLTHMQREMLGQSFFSSQRMVYLIADLLNISRLKTGKFVIEPTPVNLAEVVEQELSQLEETAASRGLKLTYDKPKQFPDLMLDETKTRQVIMNFADNAIYYTPTGGHIKVELEDAKSNVELRVVDDGIGVPNAEKPHLFTKFYRAGNARKARPDGTGLGLFMAKKVVVAQGGSIIFDSTEGKGSTFGFVFNKHALGNAKAKLPADASIHETAHSPNVPPAVPEPETARPAHAAAKPEPVEAK